MRSTSKDNHKTLLLLTTATALFAFFWYPTLKCHFSGLDEFSTFICFSKANDIRELLDFFIKPHNQHFAPLFKLMFFAEYKIFGISPAPYHMVSIGLFLLSAGLLWKFIRKETGDNTAAAFCSLAYATNSIYFSVVTWVFAQQVVLTFIFIELALLSLQSLKGRLAIPQAALFCLLASLCLNYGGAAWLFCAIYLFFRNRKARLDTALPQRPGLKSYSFLLVSASITVLLYGLFYVDTSSEYGAIPLNPLLYIHGTVIFIGNSILRSLGIHSIVNTVSIIAGKDPYSLQSALKVLSQLIFLLAVIPAALYFRKLSSNGKRLTAASFLIAGISTLIIIAARASYFDLDVYHLAGVGRYTYFPMAFITIGVAPYLSALSRRRKLVVMLLLPVWVSLHMVGLDNGLAKEALSERVLDNSMSLVKKSLNHPLEVYEDGRVYIINMFLRESRPIEDFKIIPGEQISYVDMLRLFLGPDDLLTETGQDALLLRNKRNIGDGDLKAILPATSINWSGKMARISRDSEIALRLTAPLSGKHTNRLHILSFMLKAGQKGIGYISCNTTENALPEKFNISDSIFYEAYEISIPCKRYEDAVIVLQKGTYSLDDIRLYW